MRYLPECVSVEELKAMRARLGERVMADTLLENTRLGYWIVRDRAIEARKRAEKRAPDAWVVKLPETVITIVHGEPQTLTWDGASWVLAA